MRTCLLYFLKCNFFTEVFTENSIITFHNIPCLWGGYFWIVIWNRMLLSLIDAISGEGMRGLIFPLCLGSRGFKRDYYKKATITVLTCVWDTRSKSERGSMCELQSWWKELWRRKWLMDTLCPCLHGGRGLGWLHSPSTFTIRLLNWLIVIEESFQHFCLGGAERWILMVTWGSSPAIKHSSLWFPWNIGFWLQTTSLGCIFIIQDELPFKRDIKIK